MTLAQADSGDEARAKLYQAAARILTDQYESGLAQLQAIDAKKLSKATRRCSRRRERSPDAFAKSPPHRPATAPPMAADDPAAATIHLAEAALAKSLQSSERGAAP